MLSIENVEGYRRYFLEHSPQLFEPANHVSLETMRLVEIESIEHLERFEIKSPEVLSQALSVSSFLRSSDKRGG